MEDNVVITDDLVDAVAEALIVEAVAGVKMTTVADMLREHPDWEPLAGADKTYATLKVMKAVETAADLSGWSVPMGLDKLKPCDDALNIYVDELPKIRIHFAFADDFPEDDRRKFLLELGNLINENV